MEHIFDIITIAICVAGAVFYLVKSLFLNKQKSCSDGCSKCASNCDASKVKQFTNIKTIKIHPIK